MDPLSVLLTGLVIAFVSGAIGKFIGGSGKVSEKLCGERQGSCNALLTEKVDNLGKKVDYLSQEVKDLRADLKLGKQ